MLWYYHSNVDDATTTLDVAGGVRQAIRIRTGETTIDGGGNIGILTKIGLIVHDFPNVNLRIKDSVWLDIGDIDLRWDEE